MNRQAWLSSVSQNGIERAREPADPRDGGEREGKHELTRKVAEERGGEGKGRG
jgi:hypothetical protein